MSLHQLRMKQSYAKNFIFGFLALVFLFGCGTSKKAATTKIDIVADSVPQDTVSYELIITDPGFEIWLTTNAKPMSFYSQKYYESKNLFFVNEWNNRYNGGVNPELYESYIDYWPGVDYGLELNYRLFYYFLYFEHSNRVNLSY